MPADTQVVLEDLQENHWLRCTAEVIAELEAMPTVTLVDATGAQREVCTKYIRSFFATSDTEAWHVHPELIDVEADGRHSAHLCPTCAAASRPGANAPDASIAGGRDFGLLSRIDVESPSDVEELALADVRTYSMVAKIHVPGVRATEASRTVLRGHFIAFVHDGPQVLGKHFDAARVKGALEEVQLVFVGAGGKSTQLERRALALKGLQLRPHVLYNHLALRQALGSVPDLTLPTILEITEWITGWAEKLGDRARWVEDDTVEEASLPSDIANVRDVAMDPEHIADMGVPEPASAEGEAGEPALSLDPVGVFLQSSEAVAGGIFSGMQDLLRKKESAEETEESGNAEAQLCQEADNEPSGSGQEEPQRRAVRTTPCQRVYA